MQKRVFLSPILPKYDTKRNDDYHYILHKLMSDIIMQLKITCAEANQLDR